MKDFFGSLFGKKQKPQHEAKPAAPVRRDATNTPETYWQKRERIAVERFGPGILLTHTPEENAEIERLIAASEAPQHNLFGKKQELQNKKLPARAVPQNAQESPPQRSQAEIRHELFRAGDLILGKYEVVRKLGEGGFGVVLLAKMRPEDWLIAIKIARPDLKFPVDALQRFRKEASIWINLASHPNIVQAHFFEGMGGQMLLGMEYIQPDENGCVTLADHFRRGIGLQQLVYWARDIGNGMSHAFAQGLKAHRDLKPANILIANFLRDLVGGVAKVSDFGLAGQVVPQSATRKPVGHQQVGVTVAGEISGTPSYMAPEQFRGLMHCSERSDIYSFGLILYEGVSGGSPLRQNPHCRDAAEIWADLARQHQQKAFPRLNSPLWPIIGRCINKNPTDRFGSFAEITLALENLLVDHFDAIPLQLSWQETPEGISNKALSLSQLGDHTAALEQIDRVLQLAPANAAYLKNKATILHAAGRLEEAVEASRASLKQNETDANSWVVLGLCLNRLGQPAQAVSAYRRALEIEPANHIAWANLGNCLIIAGETEEALRSFKKAVELAPAVAGHHLNLGLTLRRMERIVEARICFNNVLELDPSNVDAHCSLGSCCLDEGKLRDAAKHYRTAVDVDPRSSMAWHNLGNVLDRAGRCEDALSCFREAVKHNPEQFDSWERMGQSHVQARRAAEAVECYRRCTRIRPNDGVGWVGLGTALNFLERYEEGIKCLDKALMISPRSARAWNNKGSALGALGRYDESVRCCDEALALEPLSDDAWKNKGMALTDLGRYDEAIECYEKALALDPQDILIWVNKANLERKLGRTAAEIRSYRKLVELAPDIPAAKQRLWELESGKA